VVRGWLGITIRDLDANLRDAFKVPEGGALVETIREDGPAKSSDLHEEDVIVGVNGQKVKDSWALQQAVASHSPGEQVTLDVVRNGKPDEVKVKLGETPASFASTQGTESKPEEATGVTGSALGMSLAPVTPQIAQENGLPDDHGVFIAKVDPNSAAADRGLQPGDVIERVNTTTVKTVDDVTKTIGQAEKDHDKFVILRIARMGDDGEREMITIDVDLPA
jgi:serine protease Do